jgi:hypothetical protein
LGIVNTFAMPSSVLIRKPAPADDELRHIEMTVAVPPATVSSQGSRADRDRTPGKAQTGQSACGIVVI